MSNYPTSRHGYPRHVPAGGAPGPPPYPPIDTTDPRMPITPTPPQRAPTYQDLIVPRVFVEPDEELDALRVRAYRIAIVRDIFLIMFLAAALYYLGGLIFR